MVISKRKYYCNLTLVFFIIGLLVFIGGPILNNHTLKIAVINDLLNQALIVELIVILIAILLMIITNGGISNLINKNKLRKAIEENLISVGAYIKNEKKAYVELPKIKIKKNAIRIKLNNIRIRAIMERYLATFSTALPSKYVVEDYYITQDNAEVIIKYEDISNYQYESYTMQEYKRKIESMEMLDLYFDKKHIVNINDHPHFLISGSSGSGKSYLANQLVMQAIIKGWEVVICDLKRSYGAYKQFCDYCYEVNGILNKLKSVETQMQERMEKLMPTLDINPQALAVDIGYKPMLVVLEEYISLQATLEKKDKEELERLVKNISVLARQSNIHLMIVMQSAGTENINSTTRSNLFKILLGNAQSNVLNATFGSGVDIPKNVYMRKGEGLIGLDKITILRVPEVKNMGDFRNVIDSAAVSKQESIL